MWSSLAKVQTPTEVLYGQSTYPFIAGAVARWRDGRPQGTIFYMGVLPAHRGRGHARALLDEATRLFVAADCWRIFCDTGTSNLPMVKTFRQAGYQERAPWQRPLD